MEEFHYTVSHSQEQTRIDVLLSTYREINSRTLAQRMLKTGHAQVNGHGVSPSYKVRSGDQIRFALLAPEPAHALPQAGPLDILFEDPTLVVVNKPAGVVVHPAPGNPSGTLVNFLLHHCPDLSGIGGVLRPGVVHRLDKGTSGVLVVAKTDPAHTHLAQQFQAHSIHRQYQALVWGNPLHNRGRIAGAIGRDPHHRKKMALVAHGKPATTHWEVAARYGNLALLDCTLETGRTHQIRVHLSSQHLPIWGDAQYGRTQLPASFQGSPALKNCLVEFSQNALHAQKLGFKHPTTQQYMEFSAPLPGEFQNLIALLEKENFSQ